MPVTVIITFTAKSEMLEGFRRLLVSVKHDLPTVPGCLGVQVYCKTGDPRTFTLVESWESVDAHRTHLDAVAASGTWEIITSHLAQDPVSGYFQPL
jgi:quinol monooxygenase YgiN